MHTKHQGRQNRSIGSRSILPTTASFVALTAMLAPALPATADEKRLTGLTSEAYQKAFSEHTDRGYRPAAIRGYADNGQARYDVTFLRDGWKPFVARHGQSDRDFAKLSAELIADGYRLVIHSRFKLDSRALNAAVWEKEPLVFHQPGGTIPRTGRALTGLAPLETLMRSFVREQDVPGAALAVAKDGRLVYARGFGFADIEKKEPVQPDSLFRIASISKPVTAAAVMQLVEKDRLKLDETVAEVLDWKRRTPEVEPRLRRITIRHLLQHTGGWDRDKSFDAMFRAVEIARALKVDPPAGPEQVIRYMQTQPLDFDPGARYAYSNFGYCLLGRVIEKLTGKSYEQAVRESVLAPLGIRRMQIGRTLPEGRADGEVRYYTRDGGRDPAVIGPAIGPAIGARVPSQYGGWHLEAMDSHGGWIASAVDLVRFGSALQRPSSVEKPGFSEKAGLLSAESLQTMFHAFPVPIPRNDGDDNDGNKGGKLQATHYALGWLLARTDDGERLFWHTGSLDGTSTILVRRPDGVCFAVLFNTRRTIEGKTPSRAVAPRLNKAVQAINGWPEGDLFEEFGYRARS